MAIWWRVAMCWVMACDEEVWLTSGGNSVDESAATFALLKCCTPQREAARELRNFMLCGIWLAPRGYRICLTC